MIASVFLFPRIFYVRGENALMLYCQVIPAITNTFGIPLMLLPLFFVVFMDAVFMVRERER